MTNKHIEKNVSKEQPVVKEAIPTTSSYLIEPNPLAEAIENALGDDMIPYAAGFYLPGSAIPVIMPGQSVFRRKGRALTAMPGPTELLPAAGDSLYDATGHLLVDAADLKKLSHEPYVAAQGQAVLQVLIEETLHNHFQLKGPEAIVFDVLTRVMVPPLPSVINARFEEMLEDSEDSLTRLGGFAFGGSFKRLVIGRRARAEREVQQGRVENAYARIDGVFADTRNAIKEFLGPNPWLMHNLVMRPSSWAIEKTIDYRIYDWERRTASGEWA